MVHTRDGMHARSFPSATTGLRPTACQRETLTRLRSGHGILIGQVDLEAVAALQRRAPAACGSRNAFLPASSGGRLAVGASSPASFPKGALIVRSQQAAPFAVIPVRSFAARSPPQPGEPGTRFHPHRALEQIPHPPMVL